MRRLSRVRNEEGVVTLIVAISLVVIFGMAALVIDVGALYQERRELQNGADAAALAIAQSCAHPLDLDCIAATEVALISKLSPTAQAYADSNADDVEGSDIVIDDIDKGATSGSVTVSTSTLSADGDAITYKLAQILPGGHTDATVGATSTAVWGPPTSIRDALPIAITRCAYDANLPSALELPVKLTLHSGSGDPMGCTGPSGHAYPGGWGPLENSDDCVLARATVDPAVPGDNGMDALDNCTPSQFRETWLNEDVPIPLFASTDGSGSHGTFEVVGFGMFHLVGYDLKHDYVAGPALYGCLPGETCLWGYFKSFTTSTGTPGTGEYFGTTAIQLTKNPSEED